MANAGFICQDAYLKKTEKLDDAQVGRLFRALMVYHTTGEITPLGQIEEIAFDFIREDIDKADAAYEAKCKQNRLNRLSTTVNDRQRSSTTVEVVQTIPKPEEPDKGFMLDDEAISIQKDHDRVLDAAEDAGFKMSNNVRANLINLYAEHGLQKMLDGLTSCSEHSAPTLAYLRAVLKGEPKKSKQYNPKSAHNFTERDYTGVQEQMLKQQGEEFIQHYKDLGLWDEEKGCVDPQKEAEYNKKQEEERRRKAEADELVRKVEEAEQERQRKEAEENVKKFRVCANCSEAKDCAKKPYYEHTTGCSSFRSIIGS